MILNKYYIILISIFLLCCEEQTEYSCILQGLTESVQATSFTEWNYFSVTDTGFIELESMSDSTAQAENSIHWDIAIMRNHFRTNSGLSGPGNGGAFMIDSMWTCEVFNDFNEVPNGSIFIEDSMLTNIYQPWAHDDPDEAYTEDEGSIILENWGWFDIDDSYYFYYNEKQFIVKLADGERYIKLWPYQYYGNEGQSAHISLIYDFIIPPR